MSRLDDERKSGAIWYVIFRQSPKAAAIASGEVLSAGRTEPQAAERDSWVTGSAPRQAFFDPGGSGSSRSPGDY